jgi:site-specific DNA-adenine methylase
MRAPFPYFGGKFRAAPQVWAAFGDPPNYVEPFAGSLAILLSRPTPARIETVNDLDAHLANFWRSVAAAPEDVARWADWPVNEVDLHARHRWLVYGEGAAEFREKMRHDPELYDAKRAGWWVWGICQWIGSGWCSEPEWTGRTNAGRRARGVHTADQEPRPSLASENGIRKRDTSGSADWEKRPVLAHSNRGVHLVSEQMPMLRGDSGAAGAGIHASGRVRNKLPYIGTGGQGVTSRDKIDAILAWMLALQARLRRVRVCCGDWTRVLGRSATECIGTTGIFLDPPYGGDAGRDPSLYTHDDLDVAAKVRAWAVEHGANPKLRIAYCSYGEAPPPDGWQRVKWKAVGGYAASAGNHANAHRETIDFSPHCLPVEARQRSLFAGGGADR